MSMMWQVIIVFALCSVSCMFGYFVCALTYVNKKPSPIGHCNYCRQDFYVPHAEHMANCARYQEYMRK